MVCQMFYRDLVALDKYKVLPSLLILTHQICAAVVRPPCHILFTDCHLSELVMHPSLQGTSGDLNDFQHVSDVFPPRYFWMPTPFSWVASHSASTQRHPASPPRNRPYTRCASAPAARSTSLLQRAAPPARPWATSASGADLGAASLIGDTFNICSGAAEIETPPLVHLMRRVNSPRGRWSSNSLLSEFRLVRTHPRPLPAVVCWRSGHLYWRWRGLRNGSQSSSLKSGTFPLPFIRVRGHTFIFLL